MKVINQKKNKNEPGNDIRANIIMLDDQETEIIHIETTLQTIVIAEIPDNQEIMDSLDVSKADWTGRTVKIYIALNMLIKSL